LQILRAAWTLIIWVVGSNTAISKPLAVCVAEDLVIFTAYQLKPSEIIIAIGTISLLVSGRKKPQQWLANTVSLKVLAFEIRRIHGLWSSAVRKRACPLDRERSDRNRREPAKHGVVAINLEVLHLRAGRRCNIHQSRASDTGMPTSIFSLGGPSFINQQGAFTDRMVRNAPIAASLTIRK